MFLPEFSFHFVKWLHSTGLFVLEAGIDCGNRFRILVEMKESGLHDRFRCRELTSVEVSLYGVFQFVCHVQFHAEKFTTM